MEAILLVIFGALVTIFLVNPGSKFIDNFLNEKRESKKLFNLFLKLKKSMPDLFLEMKEDITKFPLNREFIIMRRGWIYNGQSIVYYLDDHQDLESKLKILENSKFIVDITYNNVKRYRITEEFINLLLKYA